MDDMISRQAVLDKAYEIDLSDTGNDIRVWVVDVAEVEKLPTAEKKGKWHEIKKLLDGEVIFYSCSECGMMDVDKTSFCPMCGARMEERE